MLSSQCGSPMASNIIVLEAGCPVNLFHGHFLKAHFINIDPDRYLAGQNIGRSRWWVSDNQDIHVKVLSRQTKRVPSIHSAWFSYPIATRNGETRQETF